MSKSWGKVGVEEMGQGRQINILCNLWSFHCILGIISKSLGFHQCFPFSGLHPSTPHVSSFRTGRGEFGESGYMEISAQASACSLVQVVGSPPAFPCSFSWPLPLVPQRALRVRTGGPGFSSGPSFHCELGKDIATLWLSLNEGWLWRHDWLSWVPSYFCLSVLPEVSWLWDSVLTHFLSLAFAPATAQGGIFFCLPWLLCS